jgi:Na+/phosphate symporter
MKKNICHPHQTQTVAKKKRTTADNINNNSSKLTSYLIHIHHRALFEFDFITHTHTQGVLASNKKEISLSPVHKSSANLPTEI